MTRRRRERLLAGLALAVLALAAELVGHSLTQRIDLGRHVGRVSYAHDAYYPFLLAGVKIGIALVLARVVWRFVKARRVASVIGLSPRVRVELSARLWLFSFVVTSALYLVRMDVGGATFFSPLLHSSALPIFAVLSVLVALLYRGVERWLHDYERLAAQAVACIRRLLRERTALADLAVARTPRSRFGLAFESRPPPLPA
ncbi:MAG TPA: hypothetical protein VE261_08625 [Gaiellaceae bacterium]|nr:hypothetical protein [Gaiellaceae bacterium]